MAVDSELTTNSWILLRDELRRRTCRPARQVSYVLFFLLVIIGVSALGFWFELVRAWLGAADSGRQPMLNAAYTYFPAIAFASGVQMIIGEKQSFIRSFAILILSLIGLSAIILLSGWAGSNYKAFATCAFGTLLSWFTWWIANADERFLNDINPVSSLGGSTNASPAGSTDGFNV